MHAKLLLYHTSALFLFFSNSPSLAPVPPHSIASCDGTTFQSSCALQCSPGYRGQSQSLVCNADGDWSWQSGVAIGCQALLCGRFIESLPTGAARGTCGAPYPRSSASCGPASAGYTDRGNGRTLAQCRAFCATSPCNFYAFDVATGHCETSTECNEISRADSQQLFRTGPGPSFVGCYDFEAGFTDAGENLGYGGQGRNHYTDMVFADVVSAAQAAGHRHIALACGAGKFFKFSPR